MSGTNRTSSAPRIASVPLPASINIYIPKKYAAAITKHWNYAVRLNQEEKQSRVDSHSWISSFLKGLNYLQPTESIKVPNSSAGTHTRHDQSETICSQSYELTRYRRIIRLEQQVCDYEQAVLPTTIKPINSRLNCAFPPSIQPPPTFISTDINPDIDKFTLNDTRSGRLSTLLEYIYWMQVSKQRTPPQAANNKLISLWVSTWWWQHVAAEIIE